MTPLKSFLYGVVGSLIFGTCLSNNRATSSGNGHGYQYNMRGGMLGYVVAKGCTYLSGFVQSVYARSHHPRDETCDWQTWVHTRCYALHIPTEICTGLMSCGSGCALSALRAPSDMMRACNISTRPNHDNDKRDYIDYSNLHLCDNSHGSGAFLFGRRNIGSESEQQKQNDQILHRNRGQYHVSSTSLRSWCSKFSRYIRTKYHFNEVKFVRSSPYWLVDVYKIGPKFGVPITHTHGLVGCGMEFALKALNAPNYLSFLYTGK